jgi:glutathione S-transferase
MPAFVTGQFRVLADGRFPARRRPLDKLGLLEFVRACDRVHFERVTKQRYGIGPVRQDVAESGLKEFASSAAILEQHLGVADWLVGKHVTYADFRVACVFPFSDLAGRPLADFQGVSARFPTRRFSAAVAYQYIMSFSLRFHDKFWKQTAEIAR